MAKWHFEFDVDGSKMEHVMELLIPMKIENLGFKIMAGTATKIRAGDKPGWQIVVEAADAEPRRSSFFVEKLVKAGFEKNGGYSAIDQAVRKRVLDKVKIKGINHFKIAAPPRKKGNSK